MIANLMGGDGLIVIIVALVVLVGGSQLPKMARNVGLAGKEFRKAQAEADAESDQAGEGAGAAATGSNSTFPRPVALPAGPQAARPEATAPAPSGDSITVTPAQLEALLKVREEQARNNLGGNQK